MMEASNRVTWVMTANNPVFNNDIARRTVRIRLDRKVANPSIVRGLKHPNLHEWVTRNRAALVRACLILIQSWIAAGRPLGKELPGSFEAWAATLGGILANAGIAGFLSNQATHQSRSDTESETWSELIWFWWNKWGPTEVRATAVAELCKEHDLLTDVRGSGTERSMVSRVGRALASAEDRFFGEYQLLRNPSNGGGSSLYVT
jgi:putative DNA primase/helicase